MFVKITMKIFTFCNELLHRALTKELRFLLVSFATLCLMILTPVVFHRFYHRIFAKSKSLKKIVFVGPRGTGKTTAILKILDLYQDKENVESCQYKTVPTIKGLPIRINNFEIIEYTPLDYEDSIKEISINRRDIFIFFLKSPIDNKFEKLFGFENIHFVYWWSTDAKESTDEEGYFSTKIVRVNENPEKLLLLLSDS